MATFDVKAEFKVSGLAEVNAAFKTIGGSLNNVNKQFNAFSASAAKVGRNIAIGLTAAAAAITAVSKSFSEFESQFTTVVTLLDESSFSTGSLEDGIAGLEKGILSLRASSGETFENLNQGLFDLVSAGVAAKDAIAALGTATDLALAGATDTATAVDGITTAMGAFGSEAGTAEEIAQKFFTAQKFGKTTIEELAGSLGLGAATASASGVSFEELLAASSAATTSGIRTRAAFTGLRAALSNIQRPTAAAADEAERLGISFDASALQSKGLIGVLDDVTSASGFNESSLIKLFGSTEALNVVSAVTKDNFSTTNKILRELNDSTQSAATFDEALAKSKDTVNFAARQLGGTLDSLGVEIGKSLAPAIKVLLNLFTDLVQKVGPGLVTFFTDISAKVKTFLEGFDEVDIALFFEEIRSTVLSLVDAIIGIGDTLKEGFAIALPIIQDTFTTLDLITEKLFGVGSGVAAVVFTFLKFTGIISLLTTTFGLLKAIGLLIISVFRAAVIPIIKEVILLIGVGLVNAFGAARVAAVGAFAGIVSTIALLSLGFFGLGAAIVIFIAHLLGIKITAEDVINAIKNIPAEIGNVFVVLGGLLFELAALVGIVIGEIVDTIVEGWVFAFNFITNIIGQIIAAGFSLLTQLGAAISNVAQQIADFFVGIGQSLIEKFKEFIQVIIDFGASILEGIKNIAAEVVSSLASALNGFAAFVTAILLRIRDAVISLATFIPRTIFAAFQGLVQRVGAIWDALVARIKAAIDAVKRAVTFGLAGADSNQNSGGTSGTVTAAGGGYIRGQGSTTGDKIRAFLSDKEYVVNAKAVKGFGVGFMDLINQGIMPAISSFANGGLVGDTLNSLVTTRNSNSVRRLPVPNSTTGTSGTPFTIVMPNGREVEAVTRSPSAAKELQQDIRRGNLLTSTDKPAWA